MTRIKDSDGWDATAPWPGPTDAELFAAGYIKLTVEHGPDGDHVMMWLHKGQTVIVESDSPNVTVWRAERTGAKSWEATR